MIDKEDARDLALLFFGIMIAFALAGLFLVLAVITIVFIGEFVWLHYEAILEGVRGGCDD